MTASSVRAKPSRKSISLHVLRARLIRIRPDSSTRVSTETHAARSTSTKEKKLTSPPSRRSFAKRSPSTVLASRNLRRKRSPSRRAILSLLLASERSVGEIERELRLSFPLRSLFHLHFARRREGSGSYSDETAL